MPETLNSERESDRSSPACYALVLYTYNGYEWKETFAVSFDEEKLRAEYASIDHIYSDLNLVSLEAHESFREGEEEHWVIEPVKCIEHAKPKDT